MLSRPGQPGRNRAAMLGAVFPDVSLYLLAGTSLFILQIPPHVVFDELYFSPAWQTVFAIDNSIPLYVGLLAIALALHMANVQVFCLAALLHIACDLPLHHDDGRAHFWPFTDWVFASPVSYWDSTRHAASVVPVTLGLVVAAAIMLWQRFPDLLPRLGVAAALAAEIWVSRQWLMFF